MNYICFIVRILDAQFKCILQYKVYLYKEKGQGKTSLSLTLFIFLYLTFHPIANCGQLSTK